MKRGIGVVAVVLLAAFALTGCATIYPIGSLYSDVKLPALTGDSSNVSYSKVGVSEAVSYFALIATGDASIDAAVKNGNIKTIKYIDWSANNILGVIGKYKVTVYGD